MINKKISSFVLFSLCGMSSISLFAAHTKSHHDDLYSTKNNGCVSDCRGYWGFGLGWQKFKYDDDSTVTVTATGDKLKYHFNDSQSNFSGKVFFGYNFYENENFLIGLELGAFGPAKKLKHTIFENTSRVESANTRVVSESFDKYFTGFVSLKPNYKFDDIWSAHVQAGLAMGYFDYDYDFSGINRATGVVSRFAEIKAKRIVPGWTAGLGVSMAINQNWKASLDYDYTRLTDDFSEFSNTVSTTKTDLKMDSYLVTLNLVHDFNCA